MAAEVGAVLATISEEALPQLRACVAALRGAARHPEEEAPPPGGHDEPASTRQRLQQAAVEAAVEAVTRLDAWAERPGLDAVTVETAAALRAVCCASPPAHDKAAADTVLAVGDAKSSLGDAKSPLGDATSSLGDTKSSGWLRRRKGSAYFLLEHVVHPLDGARRQVVDVRERSTVVGRRRLSDHHLSLGFHLGDVLGRGGVDHVHTHQRILHRQCSMVLRRPTRCRCLSETHPLV